MFNLVSRDQPCVSRLILHILALYKALRYKYRAPIVLPALFFTVCNAPQVNLELILQGKSVPMAFTTKNLSVRDWKSSKHTLCGSCLPRLPRGPNNVHPSFPHILLVRGARLQKEGFVGWNRFRLAHNMFQIRRRPSTVCRRHGSSRQRMCWIDFTGPHQLEMKSSAFQLAVYTSR